MKYKPKWIIYANDDMYPMDSVDKLKNELVDIDDAEVDIVHTMPSRYHSVPTIIYKRNALTDLATTFLSGLTNPVTYKIQEKKIMDRFNVEYVFSSDFKGSKLKNIKNLLFRNILKTEFINVITFFVVSYRYLRNIGGNLFDENFVFGGEDTDFSFMLYIKGVRQKLINYLIGDIVGSTLGTGQDRELRSIYSLVYFNNKYSDLFQELKNKSKARYNR